MHEDEWWVCFGILTFALAMAMDGHETLPLILLVIAYIPPVRDAVKRERRKR